MAFKVTKITVYLYYYYYNLSKKIVLLGYF